MNRRMIWVGDDEYAGWCCSECSWNIVVPHLESMVAALAFNRVAQEEFEKHNCATGTTAETAA